MKSYGKGNLTLEILYNDSKEYDIGRTLYISILPELAIHLYSNKEYKDNRIIFGWLCFRITLLLGK